MGQQKRTIAIDFDGVLHFYSRGWRDGTIYDSPVVGAFNAIKKLKDKGYNIVIFTARPVEQHKDILDWCIENANFDFDDIAVTNIKPSAIAYIDDRAIRFTNWKDILNYF